MMINFFVFVVGLAIVMGATFLIAFVFAIGLCLIFGLKLLIRIPIGIALLTGEYAPEEDEEDLYED